MRFEKAFVPDCVVTYGSQIHPADRHAGLIVTGEERAREMGDGNGFVLLATGFAHVG